MLPGVFSMAVARMLCSSIMFAIEQLGNWVIDVSTSPSGDNVQADPKQRRRRAKTAFILKPICNGQKNEKVYFTEEVSI